MYAPANDVDQDTPVLLFEDGTELRIFASGYGPAKGMELPDEVLLQLNPGFWITEE